MNDILKTLRSFFVLAFIFYLIYLFARFLLIPIFIFVLIMKLIRMINVKFKFNNQKSKNNKSNNDIIDGEFEDLD